MYIMPQQYIWIDGGFKKFNEVKVHILTHSLQYGSGMFEGIRAYQTQNGTAIFRLKDHVKRFFNTAKIFAMNSSFKPEEIEEAIISIIRKNKLKSAYIRPFAFYNDTRIGLDVTGKKVSVAIAAIPFGNYFENKERGIRCKISSWQRINSLILPPEAKISGNYANSIIASLEAKKSGADEAILTSIDGYVAEGPGENIFIVANNHLITPSREADILMGITRDSVIKIAENMGIEVEERNVHKEELYTCDEAFFTGTAAELTPIVQVDGRVVGKGKPGPITKMLEDKYYAVVNGKNKEFEDWLTIVR
jgi:branched-chain amino acid aminotransferase